MQAPRMSVQGPRGAAPPNSLAPFGNGAHPVSDGDASPKISGAAGSGGMGTGLAMGMGMQSGMNPRPTMMMTPQQQTPGANAGSHSYSNSPAINNTANMYSQLENMMNAVKKEAKSLEAVKQKIREMDAMRNTVSELRQKLQLAEHKNLELQDTLKVNDDVIEGLRTDMQRLNDIYSKEREEYQDSQQLNLSLQQEIENIKNEVQFYQKEAQKMPELRKKNSSMLTQIGALGKQQEEEKTIFAKTIKSLEEKLADTARDKQQSAEHFWNLTEENKKLVKKMEEVEEKHADVNKLVDEASKKQKVAEERSYMIAEDQLTFLTREREDIDVVKAELEGVRAEARGLRSLIDDKEEQQMTLHAKLRNIEQARVAEKGDVKGRMASLNETISHLKTKNHELERENSETQHRLGLVGGDVSRYTMEVEHLQTELSRKEVKQKQLDADWQRKLDESIRVKDDALEKLNKATNNFEAMQNQARESQSRYWEELQRVKEAESQLTEEAERLATELEEKSTKLIAAEAERSKLEDYMRGEVSGAMDMTNALRGELERRLEELSSMRKERDESQEERVKFEAQVAEMKTMMSRQEQTFQRTLENDRNKISGEIKSKMNKLRGLEVEKQELLMETSNLMKQVETTQKDLNRAKMDLETKSREANEASVRVEEMKDEAVDMEKRLKTYAQTEDELRAHADRLESSFKEDIARLDNLVKESKKAAAQQVLEISDRVKVANEETDMMKVRMKDAQEHEQKSVAEAEKSKTELEIASKSHEDMQQQMAKDMTTLRRELQDMRNKQKIHSESRTKMEMETMNARLEATKAENEANKAIEWAKEVESKLLGAQDEARKYKKEAHDHERELKKTQLKRVEAEEAIVKKQAALERMTKDMAKLERDGLVEVRRMRVNLQVAEQELNEVKPLIPLLQKELAETKAAHERTQASTNETVNGLLEELRTTEDTLSGERKKQGHDLEQYRYKLNAVSQDLEKAKEHIEQNMVYDKKSAADKDMRALQLQQELEHIKELVIKKEARMEELEKQRQSDRNRIQELRANLEGAERAIMDGKTTLELEQAQRKRLEMRLKTANSAAAAAVAADGGGGLSPRKDDHGGSGDAPYAPSTTEKRTKMLYGDHEDAAEPAYDDDIYSGAGLLDSTSALQAVGVGDEEYLSSAPAATSGGGGAAEVMRRRIIDTGIAGDDDDFMAEQANPPMHSLLSSSSSAPGVLSIPSTQDRDNGGSGEIDNTGSPVMTKVQAAIDARSQAEGTKASLKAASQQRQHDRRRRLEDEKAALGSAGEADDNADGLDDADGHVGAGGVGAERKGMVSMVRERVGSAAEYDASQHQPAEGGGGPADVEDSIQRTQMFLRQRLAQRSKGNTAADARSAAAAFATGDGGGEAGAALDAQELAAQAYERQRAVNKDSGGPGQDNYPSLGAPRLSPARPVNSINSFSPSHGQ